METQELSQQLQKTLGHLRESLVAIRAGHVTPAIVEQRIVEAYGTRSPLQQVASIRSSDAQTLHIQPWDKSILKDIEKALLKEDIGASPVIDGAIIRLSFPPLSEERREEYVKMIHEKGEVTKIAGKNLREDFLKALKDSSLSEDEEKRIRENVQKLIDEFHAELKKIIEAKEKEIRTI